MQSAKSGRSTARISPAGRCITSRDRLPIRTESMPRSLQAGLAKLSRCRTTAASPGSLSITSSRTMASPVHTSGTTERRIRGNSSGCGIWNRLSPIPTRFTQASKMQPCSVPPTPGSHGTNSEACAVTAPARTGSRAPAACACTPSSSIRRIPRASTSPSPPRARFGATMPARRGGRSIAA